MRINYVIIGNWSTETEFPGKFIEQTCTKEKAKIWLAFASGKPGKRE